MIRQCKVCGASYNTNYSCERGRSWRVHTDTAEHYYILTVLMTYQTDHDAEKAYKALSERGIDIHDTAGLLPKIQKSFAEIDAKVNGGTLPDGGVPAVHKVRSAPKAKRGTRKSRSSDD